MQDKFKAYRIYSEDGRIVSRFTDLSLDELDPGEVVVRVAYSSVNFKDALAATGKGKVIRRFPCVGGIDSCGTVAGSSDPRFKQGDPVIVTSYDLGVSHDGGFAEYARVPADWVVPLPQGMSLYDSMALGTAGYTVALGIHEMQENGLTPEKGRVVVTGATGGASSIGIDILASLGYEVVAITGKESQVDYLKQLGAAEVLLRKNLEMGTRPLEKMLWAGAVDSVGGDTLAWLTRTMQKDGTIASFGNAGGIDLNTTVLPFILRGVRLLGVDSGYTDMPLRRHIWQRLATDMRPRHLERIAQTVAFDKLPTAFDKLMTASMVGRHVVEIGG